jgi:hypothetical protein
MSYAHTLLLTKKSKNHPKTTLAISAKLANLDSARLSKTSFRNLSPEKPLNNAGPEAFSAGTAEITIKKLTKNQMVPMISPFQFRNWINVGIV